MADDAFLGEVAFAFLGLFGKNVPFEGFLVGDLSGTCDFEPFLGTGVRFDLRHCRMLFMYYPAGGSAPANHLWSRLGYWERKGTYNIWKKPPGGGFFIAQWATF